MADEAYYIPDDAERRFRETVMGVVTGQVEERMSLAWKIFHPVLTHFPMEWRNCTPDLLASGVDCASTPRRPGERGVSHQHLIVTRKARVLASSSSDAPNRTATEPVVDTDLRKRIGAAIHDAVCDCLDKGFGYTLRSRDLDAIEDAAMSEVAPVLAKLKAINDKRYADRHGQPDTDERTEDDARDDVQGVQDVSGDHDIRRDTDVRVVRGDGGEAGRRGDGPEVAQPRVWRHGAHNPERPDPGREQGMTVRNKTGHRWSLYGNQFRKNERAMRWGFWGLLEKQGELTEVVEDA